MDHGFRIKEKVYAKLAQMVDNGIIALVVEPTELASRMMVVGKPNGNVRNCLDPSELSRTIQQQNFSMLTVEQIFGKIGKSQTFLQSRCHVRILSDTND
jgi:hypothetical protein